MDEVFGRYRLVSVLGQGGMGKVYKARDTLLPRDVAIKVLSTELGAEPGYRERFRREAHMAGRLTEPHIIPIYDAGEIDGRLFLAMPIIDGTDVAELLERDGPMSPARAVRVVEQLADALHAAHAVGLIHRDVKPSNALVNPNDFVYLIDFGIAHDTAATKMTRTGAVFGSWAYMAPERFTTGTTDASGDIYALACVLYECLTGSKPYPGNSLEQQFTGHFSLDPPRPTMVDPAIPAGFDEVVARGMAKDPRRRYRTAHELASAARDALATLPSRGPSQGPEAAPAAAPPAPTRRHDPARRPAGAPAPTESSRLLGLSAAAPNRPAAPLPRAVGAPVSDSPPRAPRQRRRLRGPLIAVTVAMVVTAAVTAYLLRPHSTEPPTSDVPTAQPVPGAGPTGQPVPAAGSKVVPVNAFSGLKGPDGVAVDGAGNVYVADAGNNRVLELAVGASGSVQLPFTGLGTPSGVAVDGARAVYVTNVVTNRVLKLAPGSTSTTELPLTGLSGPRGIAVDSAEALYIAAGDRVLKLAAGSTNTTELPFTGLSNPTGVAVDGSGAVYVTDSGNNRVLRAAGDSVESLPFGGLNKPDGVAVDAAGDVYVADTGNNRVLKLPAGARLPTALAAAGLNDPRSLAVDTGGSVYVSDTGNNRVVKLAG